MNICWARNIPPPPQLSLTCKTLHFGVPPRGLLGVEPVLWPKLRAQRENQPNSPLTPSTMKACVATRSPSMSPCR